MSTTDLASPRIQVANFAVWINNDTEYEFNLRAVTDYLQQEGVRSQLPFLIWRDASVQHFSVPPLLLCPAPLYKYLLQSSLPCAKVLC